jgi:hypothetical protein
VDQLSASNRALLQDDILKCILVDENSLMLTIAVNYPEFGNIKN